MGHSYRVVGVPFPNYNEEIIMEQITLHAYKNQLIVRSDDIEEIVGEKNLDPQATKFWFVRQRFEGMEASDHIEVTFAQRDSAGVATAILTRIESVFVFDGKNKAFHKNSLWKYQGGEFSEVGSVEVYFDMPKVEE